MDGGVADGQRRVEVSKRDITEKERAQIDKPYPYVHVHINMNSHI